MYYEMDICCGSLEMFIKMNGFVTNPPPSITAFFFSGKVPQFRPQAALHFLKKFIRGDDLAPLMPSNATLAKMGSTAFSDTLAAWTEAAQGAPYVDDLDRPLTPVKSID